ncbi:MAG: dienelactone hydrolase family protein [Anaerolineales bacterium]
MDHHQPLGFLAVPPTGKGSGVLVLHAWWGLNDTMKALCTRLADAGFVAFAPDLYHGKLADNIPAAEALGSALDANHLQAKVEIAEATRFLYERAGQDKHGLAVVSFSLGSYYALHLSATDPEHIHSVVLFYGTGPRVSQQVDEDIFSFEVEYVVSGSLQSLLTLSGIDQPDRFNHFNAEGFGWVDGHADLLGIRPV